MKYAHTGLRNLCNIQGNLKGESVLSVILQSHIYGGEFLYLQIFFVAKPAK